jgi:FkbM family methyltransferase
MPALAADVLAACPPPPATFDADAGVVTAGGGRYDASLYVSLSMLRDTGCTLPVRLYHRGEEEPVSGAVRAIPGVETIDCTPWRDSSRQWGGWQVKIATVMRSGFRRVLFLDADAYPVTDPTAWIDTVADPAPPVVIWPDGASGGGTGRYRPDSYGLDADAGRRVPAINGGHYIIDVPRAWRALWLHHHFDMHSDYYYAYKMGVGGYGDQDQMRAALTLTGTPFTRFAAAPLSLDRGVWIQAGPDGVTPGIAHRVRAKFGPVNGHGQTAFGTPIVRHNAAPGEAAAHRHYAEWGRLTGAVRPRPAPPALRTDPPADWSARNNGWDGRHWAEVVRRDCYGLRGTDMAGWTVVDVGANIGTFAYVACANGAAVVHCYEPEAGNYFHLERNAALLPGVACFRAAVTACNGWVKVMPDPVTPGNVGAFRTVPGGNVPGVGINEAIDRAGGWVDLLKLDCEGSEAEILAACDLSRVGRVVLEWHPPHDPDALADRLTAAGFTVSPYSAAPQAVMHATRYVSPSPAG